MNYPSVERFLIVLFSAFLCCLGFFPPLLHAAMSPKEILSKADEARGNAEGVEWQIDIESVEEDASSRELSK